MKSVATENLHGKNGFAKVSENLVRKQIWK